MTEAQVGMLLRRFLRDHPEHIPGVRNDQHHGWIIDQSAVMAFAEWSKTNGGDPKKCEQFKTFLKSNTEPKS